MNIFSRFLSQFSPEQPLRDFVAQWDVLEALVIRVYRGGTATAEDEAIWQRVSPWIQAHYGHWSQSLTPFWQNSKVGGTLDHQDPFLMLINHAQAADFVDNWVAMQHLPAAREALNGLLVHLGEGEK